MMQTGEKTGECDTGRDAVVEMGDGSSPPGVCIVGTGDMGRALSSRLTLRGIPHLLASRSPREGQVSLEEGVKAELVILAVPPAAHPSLPLSLVEKGTVLVDISNRRDKCMENQLSQAEELQAILPLGVTVVKALNTVSAYQLELWDQNMRTVPVASDSVTAKALVFNFLTSIGIPFIDMGCLKTSRSIENLPLAQFPSWQPPLLISTILWIFLYIITFTRSHFCHKGEWGWYSKGLGGNIPLKYVNKTCDSHALNLLAACYLPGVIAAYLQICRGTKYSTFPLWLDSWLKMRKHFGLLMLFSASLHACFYLLTFAEWSYSVDIPTPLKNGTWDWSSLLEISQTPEPWDLRNSCFILTGVLGFALAVILGLSSLPSVASSLSWKEFRLIQSYLGWLCLLLCTAHCVFNGWKKLITWNYCIFPGTEQLALILPAITIVIKLPLILPCVDSRLTAIRQGTNF